MVVSMILAAAHDGLIGTGDALPWHLPRDLRRFRATTMGKPIIMGRRTHESIGRPLDGRLNIVVSRRPGYAVAGARVVGSIAEALGAAEGAPEACVIGGGEVFEAVYDRCDRVYLTTVAGAFVGRTYFDLARFAEPGWRVVAEERWPADARNPHDCRYRVLERADRCGRSDSSAPATTAS